MQVSSDTLSHIFRTILDWHLAARQFPAAVKALSGQLINATLDVYSQSMARLLPTPTKSHYVFNLRDFARVVQVGWVWLGGALALVCSRCCRQHRNQHAPGVWWHAPPPSLLPSRFDS